MASTARHLPSVAAPFRPDSRRRPGRSYPALAAPSLTLWRPRRRLVASPPAGCAPCAAGPAPGARGHPGSTSGGGIAEWADVRAVATASALHFIDGAFPDGVPPSSSRASTAALPSAGPLSQRRRVQASPGSADRRAGRVRTSKQGQPPPAVRTRPPPCVASLSDWLGLTTGTARVQAPQTTSRYPVSFSILNSSVSLFCIRSLFRGKIPVTLGL